MDTLKIDSSKHLAQVVSKPNAFGAPAKNLSYILSMASNILVTANNKLLHVLQPLNFMLILVQQHLIQPDSCNAAATLEYENAQKKAQKSSLRRDPCISLGKAEDVTSLTNTSS